MDPNQFWTASMVRILCICSWLCVAGSSLLRMSSAYADDQNICSMVSVYARGWVGSLRSGRTIGTAGMLMCFYMMSRVCPMHLFTLK
jgi:hypothetical protein